MRSSLMKSSFFIFIIGLIVGLAGGALFISRSASRDLSKLSDITSVSPSPSEKTGDSESSILDPGPSVKMTSITIYFGNTKKDQNLCSQVFPVQRQVEDNNGKVRLALEELLKGPTSQEGTMDYFTNIPPGVKIQSFRISGDTAFVDFDETLERGVSGLCRIVSIKSQINQTLQQFPEINNVVVSIDGRRDILVPSSLLP